MKVVLARVGDVETLVGFRVEAAGWLAGVGSDQWQRPYPVERLLRAVEAGEVFLVRDEGVAVATVTLAGRETRGLWTERELGEPSLFVSKLAVARTHAGRNLGGRLLDWAGDRAHRAGAVWLRLDAWTSNEALQAYYLRQGFRHVRTVRQGEAVYGGPRVSGWLAQRPARPAEHGFVDETPTPEPRGS
ncbi:GNAT family N-acetyltransferase [Streptomyces flavalbus]|uniref:GNAT family N-acetyltransferase n=1 Tax=Streptomyces flavalbus TaxID=2665155 RepID=A0ABW2WCD6_9ACTN